MRYDRSLQDSRRSQSRVQHSLASSRSAVLLQRATRWEVLEDSGVRKSASPLAGWDFTRRRPFQQRFRSRERHCGAPCVEIIFFHKGRQEGGIEIPVDDSAIGKRVLPLAERFLDILAAYVVELGKLRGSRVDSTTFAPAGFSLLAEHRDEHSSSADLGTASEVLLEAPIADILRFDRGPLGEKMRCASSPCARFRSTARRRSTSARLCCRAL